jgi:hypothetical protein
MKSTILLLLAFTFVLLGCSLILPLSHRMEFNVSLGPFSSFPAGDEYAVVDAADLIKYGGKKVVFSVVGIDAVNDTVNLIGVRELAWTGGNPSDSTQFATYTFNLGFGTKYAAGRYTFRMYIDWNGNSTLDGGDLVFESYAVSADKDNDPGTSPVPVAADEYGTSVVYNASDYSITIEDPLSSDTGLAWVITSIGEGPLLVHP